MTKIEEIMTLVYQEKFQEKKMFKNFFKTLILRKKRLFFTPCNIILMLDVMKLKLVIIQSHEKNKLCEQLYCQITNL